MPRKIIVLSDGTGNSSAKLARTNVWRTFQALDLSQGDQLAIYDDGVGNSSVKALAALGGAFGWGLQRNVLHLYKFLCRNYRAGDEIYGFGFSRGAFTIRVLMGLVLTQGLVRWNSEEELGLLANAAYRAYRAEKYHRGASLSRLGRRVRDAWIAVLNRLRGLRPYTASLNQQVDAIAFLGLWDTVDAYGMPIKELKTGIDRYVWPLYFDSLALHPKVRFACHALALDDERETFHPLVWDETAEPTGPGQKRINQVWFPGVHSNVGGGYPDDALSHVPLLWILGHAETAGLRFNPATVAGYRLAASPYGKMYDSRSGISSYYRYAPRRVESYPCTPVVDESAYLRMANGSDQYAPISIPAPLACAAESELVWDTVWWRRASYWLMVTLTVGLVALGFVPVPLEGTDEWARDIVANLVSLAKTAAPSFMAPWLDQLTESPAAVFALLMGILATFVWGNALAGRITDRAAGIWKNRPATSRKVWVMQNVRRWKIASTVALGMGLLATILAFYRSSGAGAKGTALAALLVTAAFYAWRRRFDAGRIKAINQAPPVELQGWGLRFSGTLRNCAPLVSFWEFMSDTAIPFVFAMSLLYAGVHAVNRVAFAAMDLGGYVCRDSAAPVTLGPGESKSVVFPTSNPCFATGISLEKGAKYEIVFTDRKEWRDWKDDTIPVGSLEGFPSNADAASWFMTVAAPMRRQMTENWFRPVAHIGNHSLSERMLGEKTEISDTARSGELFLFVNDAIVGFPWGWDYFYRNNHGSATVSIRRVANAAR